MQNTTTTAIAALESAASYQRALIKLADENLPEHKKRRLYRAALKTEKAIKTIMEVLSTSDVTNL